MKKYKNKKEKWKYNVYRNTMYTEIQCIMVTVPVKFGVGVALIIAAHFVLVRRWNNADAELIQLSHNDEVINLTRRNTIIVPPSVKETGTLKTEDDKQTITPKKKQTYETLRSQYEKLKNEDIPKNVSLENTSNQLEEETLAARKIQGVDKVKEKQRSKVMSSEEETEDVDDELETSEGERVSGGEEYEEEEDEEQEEEEEELEDEEEEIEDVDDSELVARLEAKYGKLATPQDSELEDEIEDEEEIEDDYEEEEEEEEIEDEDVTGWKRK